jgi:Leucine-rich repeat (LRR) protein
MTALKVLDAQENAIAKLPASIFALSKLDTLLVNGNMLAELPPLGGMNALHTLDISDNRVTALGENVSSLAKLKHFNAQRNAIEVVHTAVLQISTLEVFDFEGNPLPLHEVPGYADYFNRRKSRVDKGIAGNVKVKLLNEKAPS